jgi:hypothetical protein
MKFLLIYSPILRLSDSLGLWTLPIFQNSKQLSDAVFQKVGLYPTSGEGREKPTLLGPLERAILNDGIMDKVHKTNESVCYTPLSKHITESTSRKAH